MSTFLQPNISLCLSVSRHMIFLSYDRLEEVPSISDTIRSVAIFCTFYKIVHADRDTSVVRPYLPSSLLL